MTKQDHFLAAGFTARPEPTAPGHGGNLRASTSGQAPFPLAQPLPDHRHAADPHREIRTPEQPILSPLDQARSDLRNRGVRVPDPQATAQHGHETRVRAPKNRRQTGAEPGLPTIRERSETPPPQTFGEMGIPVATQAQAKNPKWYDRFKWGKE